MTNSSKTRFTQRGGHYYRHAPRGPASETVATRRQAVLDGHVTVPDGHGVCPECFRVKRLRADGTLYGHNYCTGEGQRPL